MNKLKAFFILSGYQITWFACILGEKIYTSPLMGFFTGLAFVLIYFFYVIEKSRFIFIILAISIPGYLFDSLVVYFNIYDFNSNLKIGLLPIWMLILWLSFAILFDEVLFFLKNFKIPGIFLSALLGPLTYYLGEPLGIIKINNLTIFIIVMIIFWSLLMYFYLEIIIKKYNYSVV